MTFSSSSSAFAAVTRYFGNARSMEGARLAIPGYDGRPVSLSPAEAHDVLYGPSKEPDLCAAVWQAALSAARAERGPRVAQRLLLIWLSLPRLAGTVHRICDRLRADRSDVEAEMLLALLEGLRTLDSSSPRSAHLLIKEARNRGWRFARSSRHESPSARLEGLADGSSCTAGESSVQPRAPQRSAAAAERLEGDAFTGLIDDLGLREVVRHAVRPGRRRRTGAFSLRPGGRRP